MAGFAGTSLLRDGYVGRAKLVVDRASDTLVGATFVGADVAELVHAATVAVVGERAGGVGMARSCPRLDHPTRVSQ